MRFETTATRIWKKLTRDERLAAAEAFWKETPPELGGSALGAIVRSLKLRPQVARSLPVERRTAALASVLEPGESVAGGLLIALHLANRRPLLGAFLDALGLPHEDGLLKEEADALPAPTPDAVAGAAKGLLGSFSEHEVETYLNTLWLQDSERWAGLERLAES